MTTLPMVKEFHSLVLPAVGESEPGSRFACKSLEAGYPRVRMGV
jgi:hypothetical protein